MKNEKEKVAFSSVIAAIFLTIIKIVVAVMTGSLGILSEAAHSALDLGAAVVTFFAVKLSAKPADPEHNYGHGKIESFSALIETLLLLVTCGWIVFEAVERLFFGKAVVVGGTFWGIVVLVISIVINISRARALKKVAQKYGSQALEADALHFDTDVWSSLVVIGGLVCVELGKIFKLPILEYGDPVAALGVSVLVIIISLELGKRTIDVLLDTAPKGMINNILNEVNCVSGVLDIANVRIRPSGPKYFVDLNIGLDRRNTHDEIHAIVGEVRERLERQIREIDVVISTFPVDITTVSSREVYGTVKRIVEKFPNCTNIHNLHVYEVAGKKHIAIHLEVKLKMSLNESHDLAHQITDLVKEQLNDVQDVNVYFEQAKQENIQAEDITQRRQDLVALINALLNKTPSKINCHDIKLYQMGQKIAIFLHCELSNDCTTERIERITEIIATKIRTVIANIEGVHIHVEPRQS